MLFMAISVFAQTGKISGTVIDKNTGEALPGVNVFIEGTTLGASTDVDGFYVVLRVPVGKHVVKANYVGYADAIIRDVVVNIDNTTVLNLEMQEAVGGTNVVEVVAKRALIRKEETNTRQVRTSEEIKNLPVTNVVEIVQQTAGVVSSEGDNNLNVRGGRSNQTQFRVDDVNQSNLFDGSFTNDVNQNAIEEITVQTGGFSAEYGDVTSGLIQVATKTGGRDLEIVAEAVSDEIYGDRLFGTNSLGYSKMNFNIGGPITDEITYFGSFEYSSVDDLSPSWIMNGPKKDKNEEMFNYVANLKYNVSENFQIRMGASWKNSMNHERSHARSFFSESENYQRIQRIVYSANLKGTYAFNANTYLDFSLKNYHYFRKSADNKWWDDWKSYGSMEANQGQGSDPGLITANGLSPGSASSFDARLVTPTNAVYNAFSYRDEDRWSGKLNFATQLDKHDLRIGGEFSVSVFREYTLSPRHLWSSNGYELSLANLTNHNAAFAYGYGYDLYGNKVDEGDYWNGAVEARLAALKANPENKSISDMALLEQARRDAITNPLKNGATAPKKNIKVGFWINDVYSINDLVINAGLRVDYFNPNDKQFKNPKNPFGKSTGDAPVFDPDDLEDSDTFLMFSPRIGFTFPVSESIVFTANFSKVNQAPLGRDMYNAINEMYYVATRDITYLTLKNPNLKPSETTAYELSVKTQLSDDVLFTVTGYYKENKNEVAVRNYEYQEQGAKRIGPGYVTTYQNVDFGTAKGIDLSIQTRRIEKMLFALNYSLAYAYGTGSSSGSQGGTVLFRQADYPLYEAPLDYDQRHTLTFNMDYRYGNDEGPNLFGKKILENFGANLTVKYNSGRPYTGRSASDSFNGRDRETAPPTSLINALRQPDVYSVDLRLEKGFDIKNVSMSAYIDVLNLLNTENIINVHRTGGTPGSDGFLHTPSGKIKYTENNQEAYNYRLRNPYNWGAPRQVRFGLRVNL
jgi:outer membrane receptor protein involved in Fe transport